MSQSHYSCFQYKYRITVFRYLLNAFSYRGNLKYNIVTVNGKCRLRRAIDIDRKIMWFTIFAINCTKYVAARFNINGN